MNVALTDNRQARVPYDDLREWIVEADKLGELVRASGYSWQEDIGMAAELLQHDAKAPVALFDEIPGYPKGFRVLTNFFGGRRQNMTLGLPPRSQQDRAVGGFSYRLSENFRQAAAVPGGRDRSGYGERDRR